MKVTIQPCADIWWTNSGVFIAVNVNDIITWAALKHWSELWNIDNTWYTFSFKYTKYYCLSTDPDLQKTQNY